MASASKRVDAGSKSARKSLFKIGEVASITGTTTRTLRYYEEMGLIAPVSRTHGRFRLYTEDVIDTVRLVKSLCEAGFSLKEVSTIMDFWAHAESGKQRYSLLSLYIKGRLKAIRKRVRALKEIEKKLKLFLERLTDCEACPEKPAQDTCMSCPTVDEMPLEPLVSSAWKVKNNGEFARQGEPTTK